MARIAAESHHYERARALLSLAILSGAPDDEFATTAVEALDRRPTVAHLRQQVTMAGLHEDDLTLSSCATLDDVQARTESDPERALAALSVRHVTALDPARAGTVAATLVRIGAAKQEVLNHLVADIARFDTIDPLDTIACLRAVARQLPHIALRLSRIHLEVANQCRVVSAVAAEVAKEDVAAGTRLVEERRHFAREWLRVAAGGRAAADRGGHLALVTGLGERTFRSGTRPRPQRLAQRGTTCRCSSKGIRCEPRSGQPNLRPDVRGDRPASTAECGPLADSRGAFPRIGPCLHRNRP